MVTGRGGNPCALCGLQVTPLSVLAPLHGGGTRRFIVQLANEGLHGYAIYNPDNPDHAKVKGRMQALVDEYEAYQQASQHVSA